MKTGFFYGAGWNAEQNIARWIRHGWNPYCFIDTDQNKQHKLFAGKYEILSLHEAIDKYGEQTIYITLTEKYWPQIIDFLKKSGIPGDRVVPLDNLKLNQQKRAQEHIAAADEFLRFGRCSKRVLDLGCGNGLISKTTADYYNVLVTGIDVRCSQDSGVGWSIETMDSRDMHFGDNSFDAIISIATLEHLSDFEKVLSEMYRCLRPNGRVYMTGGPIWTCAWGHHYNHHLVRDPIFSILPKFCHLYMSKNDMVDFLNDKGFAKETVSNVIYNIYESEYLNRSSASQIVEQVVKSDFHVNEINQKYSNNYSSLPNQIKSKLLENYSAADLEIGEMIVKLSK